VSSDDSNRKVVESKTDNLLSAEVVTCVRLREPIIRSDIKIFQDIFNQ
jgi:hypothetical protein